MQFVGALRVCQQFLRGLQSCILGVKCDDGGVLLSDSPLKESSTTQSDSAATADRDRSTVLFIVLRGAKAGLSFEGRLGSVVGCSRWRLPGNSKQARRSRNSKMLAARARAAGRRGFHRLDSLRQGGEPAAKVVWFWRAGLESSWSASLPSSSIAVMGGSFTRGFGAG